MKAASVERPQRQDCYRVLNRLIGRLAKMTTFADTRDAIMDGDLCEGALERAALMRTLQHHRHRPVFRGG